MIEPICSECHGTTIGEECGFCGNPLCPMCFEGGCGFCSANHTQQQIDDYEDSIMGPPDEQKKRQRQARDELKALGIL